MDLTGQLIQIAKDFYKIDLVVTELRSSNDGGERRYRLDFDNRDYMIDRKNFSHSDKKDVMVC